MKTKPVYQLNDDGFLIGETVADESPLEEGVFLMPRGCVDATPLPDASGMRQRLVDNEFQYIAIPVEPTLPTTEESETAKLRAAEFAVQRMLDAEAMKKGYDGILSAASYAALPVGESFQAEGASYLLWRAKCWAKCYEILAAVKAGARDEPTIEQLIAEMPELVLP